MGFKFIFILLFFLKVFFLADFKNPFYFNDSIIFRYRLYNIRLLAFCPYTLDYFADLLHYIPHFKTRFNPSAHNKIPPLLNPPHVVYLFSKIQFIIFLPSLHRTIIGIFSNNSILSKQSEPKKQKTHTPTHTPKQNSPLYHVYQQNLSPFCPCTWFINAFSYFF